MSINDTPYIRFVMQPGARHLDAPLDVDVFEVPRIEEFVEVGDGMNWWVRSVRWLAKAPSHGPQDANGDRIEVEVELVNGHPPYLRRMQEAK